MAKQLVFSEDARRKLKTGIDTLANAVSTTLGPKGRNVALDKKFGAPTVTHDGVTVAKEIELKIHMKIWALNFSKKLQPKPTISLVTEQQPLPFWLKISLTKV